MAHWMQEAPNGIIHCPCNTHIGYPVLSGRRDQIFHQALMGSEKRFFMVWFISSYLLVYLNGIGNFNNVLFRGQVPVFCQ